MATISVVIPTYNCAHCLPRAIHSVTAQTVPDVEVIVVDDGSSDDVAGAITSAADERVRVVVHEVNRGLPAARNTGIRSATGQYIAFLDADDWWEPTKLEAQIDLLKAAPALDVVFCDFAHVLSTGEPIGWQGGLGKQLVGRGLALDSVGASGYELRGEVARCLVLHTSFMHPSTVVVRRETVERVGYFDETMRHLEDLEMWIRIARECRIGLVDAVLVHVEQRTGSMSRKYKNASIHTIRLYEKLALDPPSRDVELAMSIRHRCATEHQNVAWELLKAGDARGARSHYWAAFQHCGEIGTLYRIMKSYIPRRAVDALRQIKSK